MDAAQISYCFGCGVDCKLNFKLKPKTENPSMPWVKPKKKKKSKTKKKKKSKARKYALSFSKVSIQHGFFFVCFCLLSL